MRSAVPHLGAGMSQRWESESGGMLIVRQATGREWEADREEKAGRHLEVPARFPSSAGPGAHWLWCARPDCTRRWRDVLPGVAMCVAGSYSLPTAGLPCGTQICVTV